MKKTDFSPSHFSRIIIFCFLIFLIGCSQAGTPVTSSTNSPFPTYTALPTLTSYPTFTMYPTLTPYPINTTFPTLTPLSTYTLLPTLTPYSTYTPYPTFTPQYTTTPAGWEKSVSKEIEIWMPKNWKDAEISPELYKFIGSSLTTISPDLGRLLEGMLSQSENQFSMVFYAYDPEDKDASISIFKVKIPAGGQKPFTVLGSTIVVAIDGIGAKNINFDSNMNIGELSALRITADWSIKNTTGENIPVSPVLYIIGDSSQFFFITLIDLNHATSRLSIFDQIANSFRLRK